MRETLLRARGADDSLWRVVLIVPDRHDVPIAGARRSSGRGAIAGTIADAAAVGVHGAGRSAGIVAVARRIADIGVAAETPYPKTTSESATRIVADATNAASELWVEGVILAGVEA